MKVNLLFFLLFLGSISFAQSFSKLNYSGFDPGNPGKMPVKNVSEYSHIIGDDAPDETWVISGDTSLVGDMILLNEGQVILQSGSSFRLQGNLVCLDESAIHANNADVQIAGHYYGLGHSVIEVDSCNVEFPMDYRYQYGLFIMDTAVAGFTDSDFSFNEGLLEGSVSSYGNLSFARDSFAQTVTISAMNNSTLTVSECINAWEFLLNDSCDASFSHCESLILWFYFPENITATYAFPAGVSVEDMDFNGTIPGLEDIPYSVSIDSCYNVNWGMFPMAGSNVTIENSDMRTCGLIFRDGEESSVSGIFNEQFYTAETFDTGDRQLHLNNTRVRTWNFYTMNASVLNIENCFFGEALSMDDGIINTIGGICDGSGGYFGANHATINAFASQIECQVVLEGRSGGSFVNSELYFPWSAHVFAGHTLAVFANTRRNQAFSVRDTSIVVDLAIDTLNMQQVNDLVSVRGNAGDFEGDVSPYFVSEYRLFYAPGSSPDERTLIRDGIPGGIYQDEIAVWNTNGLLPGEYILYLQAVVNGDYDNPPEISQVVNLYDFTGIQSGIGSEIAIYPNPVSEILYVTFPKGMGRTTIRILNALGEPVISKHVNAGAENTDISVLNLNPGLYILKVNEVCKNFVVK